MNRAKALSIADRIMTRIETDRAIHKDALADEIQAGDAIDEIVDVISYDEAKGQWVHRDGTEFDILPFEKINVGGFESFVGPIPVWNGKGWVVT